MPKVTFRPADALALLVLTVASAIGINQYTYGVYNHCITLPFIKSVLNPELYPHDYLVAEKQYFYTYFLTTCAFLVNTFRVSLPVMCFVVYFLSLYATLAGVFLTAIRIFQRKEVAYMATMMLIFSFTTLGMERTVENLLMERTFVLPLLLFSFYALLGKNYNISALLAGLAFLFHPLSALYALAILMVCYIYQLGKDKKFLQLATCIGIVVLTMSPIFIMKMQNPAPSLSLFHVNADWLELLRLRSAHHIFPSAWSRIELLQGIAFIIGFVMTWKYRPKAEFHSVAVITLGVVLLMFLAGTVFTEIIPVSIVIQFQLFRSYKFIFFFAIIYFAHYIFTAPNTPKGIAQKLLVTALILAPYMHETKTVMVGVTLLLFTVFVGRALLNKFNPALKKYLIPAQLAMLLLLGIAGSMHKVHFSIYNAMDKQWLTAQLWVQQNTPNDALIIVPPYLEGFRVESERTVYGEWKDGTQAFFNPLFGHEWTARMAKLGYTKGTPLKESYTALSEDDFRTIAADMASMHPTVYAVVPVEMNHLDFPVNFSNEKFNIVEVTAAQQSEQVAHIAPAEQIVEQN